METIIVTGCNGQLGRAINKELNGKYELVNTDVFQGDGITPLDITNVDAVVELARKVKPAAIVNCAAYTAVDKQESDVDLSYKINAIGPRNLAIASTEVGAKLVHVSTDYVFEGNGTRPYVEFDKTNPVSVYGKTKLAGEEFVKQFAKESFIIRTAWLYGDGKNFVKTMLSLSEKYDEVSVVKDQLGTPTSTTELAKAIHYLLPTQNYGTFHGTCEGDTNWADFTEEIFRIAGKKTKVNHVTTEEYVAKNPQSAPRPAYSILENYMFKLTSDFMFADWHDAIEQYLKELL
ncbi:dTDP-4-dehydrorhamnose reductase [Butyrivibrio sp. INlla18]|jgi:dTDP-4-dehydrorhamnose reductase|uniref:dTDP-4-dehydrorhamnose reductase n=1 Tax=unclassified Butyrivibrio TaxID=2639466 RepID=UPI0008814F5B|nr:MULTISPECIES: dTDP-4-dehydrorhamnose reductase [unclassified Butyrivibrio]MBE5839835.1 dTDP-4-dehydrorhamnose reductase [Butyrivibrio sp.]SDA43330.1 dTDP-4-dehydrorhamnose reductase [Butyrivibrio sp. INlla18]